MNTLDSIENQINVILVTNPFDIEGSRKIYTYEYQSGNRARYYIQKALLTYNPVINSELNIVVGVNGEIIDHEDNWYIYPKDTITICPVIQGGGGGGGNKALRTVASLAVLAASIWVGVGPGAALLGLTATQAAVAGVAVGIVGNLLVNALFPTAMPSIDGLGSLGDWGQASPTYGWTVTDNPIRESSPLPELFGRTLCTPPIISKHITTTGDKQYLNILLALCQGPITYVDEIYINDSPIDNYKDIVYDIRNGAVNNEIIDYFKDTFIDQPVGYKLQQEFELTDIIENVPVVEGIWYSFTTDDDVKRVSINIDYPAGIYVKKVKTTSITSSSSSYNDGGSSNDGNANGRSSGTSGRGGNTDGSSSGTGWESA